MAGRLTAGDQAPGDQAARDQAPRDRMSRAEVTRTLVLWCPDWPVHATLRDGALPAQTALALVEKGRVFACSPAARAEGVRRGMRVREAQSRHPDLMVLPYDAATDARAFEPVIAAIEVVAPGLQVLRPGTCALPVRGASRFYGSDEEAGLWLLDAVDALGVPDARVGVADGPFTAEQAARSTTRPRIRVVEPGASASFLAPLPVQLLHDEHLVALLLRLGVRTLGGFAALGAEDVRSRFGADGALLHALAGGLDSRRIAARTPPPDLEVEMHFEPPLDRIDQVAFALRTRADEFISTLTSARLVATSIRVEIESADHELSGRAWLHPRSFSPADVIDRVRWQLQGAGGAIGLRSEVARVTIAPESVDPIGAHEVGLWGQGADERIHHGLARVQSMLGHGGVLTAVPSGGRSPLEQRTLVAWGDRSTPERPLDRPWAGALPDPAPSTVFERAMPVTVTTSAGAPVLVDERDTLSGAPALLSTGREGRRLVAWAGPWPLQERWWDAAARRSHRFQVVDDRGCAWLLVLENTVWSAVARYD